LAKLFFFHHQQEPIAESMQINAAVAETVQSHADQNQNIGTERFKFPKLCGDTSFGTHTTFDRVPFPFSFLTKRDLLVLCNTFTLTSVIEILNPGVKILFIYFHLLMFCL
jgi:hypothetical protein